MLKIFIKFSSKSINFVSPTLFKTYARYNHAEIKIVERIRRDSNQIAKGSKVYLSADKITCITCEVGTWQFNYLNEILGDWGMGLSVEFLIDLIVEKKINVEDIEKKIKPLVVASLKYSEGKKVKPKYVQDVLKTRDSGL